MATIINSMSFVTFARTYGPTAKFAQFTNKETGEIFHTIVFINKKDEKTLVNFSSKMGELSPRDIVAQARDLQVVQLESGNWKLCKQGDSWETIDLSSLL